MADHSLDEKSITGSSVEDLSHVDQSKLREVDVAIGIAAGHTNDEEITPEEAKRIRRKLDWHILPLLFLLYTRMLHFTSMGIIHPYTALGSSKHR